MNFSLSLFHFSHTVHFIRRKVKRRLINSRPCILVLSQAAQVHYRKSDVTLACERCCVYKRLCTHACMGCKQFFLKERKNVMFLNTIDLPLILACCIDLVTVFDAILTSRQTREKLQCLYENLISNNFRTSAVLKKI